jgi:hypothetical protein
MTSELLTVEKLSCYKGFSAKFPDRLNREFRSLIREFEFPDQTFEQGITARRSECDFVNWEGWGTLSNSLSEASG